MNSFYVRSKPWQNVVEGEARQNLSIPKLLLHALSRIVLSDYRTLITAIFVVVSVVSRILSGSVDPGNPS